MSLRPIELGFWFDNFIQSISILEKFFYFYLILSPYTSNCGVVGTTIEVISSQMGINQAIVPKLIENFVEYGKIVYDYNTNEILLLNWLKYHPLNSRLLISAARKIKSDFLKEVMYENFKIYGMSDADLKRFKEIAIRPFSKKSIKKEELL